MIRLGVPQRSLLTVLSRVRFVEVNWGSSCGSDCDTKTTLSCVSIAHVMNDFVHDNAASKLLEEHFYFWT
jgi:hypothetical protein